MAESDTPAHFPILQKKDVHAETIENGDENWEKYKSPIY
jgi:hypothetical protein